MKNKFKTSDIQSWVFDLDNTLYPASCNLFAQVDRRMREFVSDYLGIAPDDAYKIQKQYFRECGTTLRGLMTHHDMEPAPYLDYVHDIDISPVEPSPALVNAINALPGQKYIFTNASAKHAIRIMERLEVTDLFEGIFDIVDAGYDPKPNPHVYDQFIQRFAIDPGRAAMFEDMAKNLKPAADLGMACVWVKTETNWAKEGHHSDHIHFETDDLVGWLNAVNS